ncbi:hypothetical protein BZG02_17960 [Labilibaculum filiforme]|uniref:HutD-family protein n=1 Tax=Labilibaculum filiforme TaxID=1940526 RepID=A0A2N3HRS1_9BACT|nr:HutD family protein [Labilibaculum filiforme]PKQ60756.1 hypothetical protein BZG02_17960 [Labilibaculum filiforme]
MNIEILRADAFQTINWAGGTSTQLFIYPPTSTYQQRDFTFRLSTATVEIEKSDFTSLPGVSRKLMILEGAIEIIHENKYRKKLNKFNTDSFEGDWNTSSVGKCIDFNLMTRGNAKGELSALTLEKNQTVPLPFKKETDFLILSVFSGEIELNTKEERQIVKQGSLCVITQLDSAKLEIKGITNSEVILSEIAN